MKALGLDIATLTGWSLIEDGKLIDYGTIQINSQMDLPQRLHYFHLELTRVLERIQPDWCFVEDVILGISGAKTLAYLGRLNGVALNSCFGVMQQRVKLYTPDYWKANSIDGLGGHAKKWQIQLAVVKHFDVPITGNFESIENQVLAHEGEIEDKKVECNSIRADINTMKAALVRKRNPLDEDQKKALKNTIKEHEKSSKQCKVDLKKIQTDFDKVMTKTCLDISAQTGLTPDICDSCGVALCGIKEL